MEALMGSSCLWITEDQQLGGAHLHSGLFRLATVIDQNK